MLDRVKNETLSTMKHTICSINDLRLDVGGNPFLGPLTCEIRSMGCTIVMGPNGAGKSLFLRLLHGLMRPSGGTIDWHRSGKPLKQAMVFQKPVLLRRSVAANLDYVLQGRGKAARRQEWLEKVGLADRAHQPARLLSGGEQQRLALARALATGPDVLFLDEPTSSLDPASVAMIENIVQASAHQGVKVIMVTHDIGQARRLADDVLFLHRGQLAEEAPSYRFFSEASSKSARAFLAGEIVL